MYFFINFESFVIKCIYLNSAHKQPAQRFSLCKARAILMPSWLRMQYLSQF